MEAITLNLVKKMNVFCADWVLEKSVVNNLPTLICSKPLKTNWELETSLKFNCKSKWIMIKLGYKLL